MIESKNENGILTIILPPRIDASNASAVEQEIEGINDPTSDQIVVFDADQLEYISSAGLRIIIKVVKREKSVSVVNVSQTVYDIFEVSGFTNFISIEKKA